MENRRRVMMASAGALIALLLTLLFPFVKNESNLRPTACTTANAVKAVQTLLIKKGFDKNSFAVSATGFNPPKGAEAWKAGGDAFASNPVLTLKQLNQLLKAKSGGDALAAAIINERLAGRKATPVAVMFVGTVHIEGNLGVYGGQTKNLGTRKSAAGDIVWVWVDQANCKVIPGLVVRAGCGNPGSDVNPTPGPRPGPTPGPTPPGPTPNPTCPPGQTRNVNDVCVEPKSNDPKDYTYPSGKPPVPRVTTPPEASPPPVATSKPGGGGVTDNPTTKPGDESGVTAPSASPAPTTTPTPPPNEGGDNGGSVGGGF